MEKADTTMFYNEKSEQYNNFVMEKCDNLVYKESRFCSECRLLVCMVDSHYIIDHEPHMQCLPGTSNPHQEQTNLCILNHHPNTTNFCNLKNQTYDVFQGFEFSDISGEAVRRGCPLLLFHDQLPLTTHFL